MAAFKRNVIFNKAGGNAGKESYSYKISLPANIIHGLGIEKDDRGVILEWDEENKRLTVTKAIITDDKAN